MPNINVMFWNVENFGEPQGGRRGNYQPLCEFIAQAVANANVDVLCLMELKQAAVAGAGNPMDMLHQSLETAVPLLAAPPLPPVDWHYDWLPGALMGGSAPPYNTLGHLAFTGQARNEGYAVYWKQNVSKFVMQPADPILPGQVGGPAAAPAAPNTQSFGVSARRVVAMGAIAYGPIIANVDVLNPGGGAGWQPYILPAGTTAPAVPILSGGAVVLAAGVMSVAAIPLNAGDVIPAGTQIGFQGVTLNNNVVLGRNPILVPGNYVLTDNLTLPPLGSRLVPQHILNLVLTGRSQLPGGGVNGNFGNFPLVPPNDWEMIHFCDGIGAFYPHPWLTRRPAYCTIKVNTAPPVANQLIPITTYHTPLAAPGRGMRRAAFSRSLYQAYDHAAGAYVNNTRAIIGGDYNNRLSPNAGHFTIYTNAFGVPAVNNGGANCNNAAGQGIRVNTPFPAAGLPAPVYPIPPLVPGPANNPANKSSVGLRDSIIVGPQVLSANTDHYRRSPFDNVFYRGFTPAQSPPHVFGSLYDLLQAVLPAGVIAAQIPAAVINAFSAVPVFNPPGVAGPVAPGAIANVLLPVRLLADIVVGTFPAVAAPPPAGVLLAGPPGAIPANVTPARRAAEFIRLFVSDHFPVLFRMNL